MPITSIISPDGIVQQPSTSGGGASGYVVLVVRLAKGWVFTDTEELGVAAAAFPGDEDPWLVVPGRTAVITPVLAVEEEAFAPYFFLDDDRWAVLSAQRPVVSGPLLDADDDPIVTQPAAFSGDEDCAWAGQLLRAILARQLSIEDETIVPQPTPTALDEEWRILFAIMPLARPVGVALDDDVLALLSVDEDGSLVLAPWALRAIPQPLTDDEVLGVHIVDEDLEWRAQVLQLARYYTAPFVSDDELLGAPFVDVNIIRLVGLAGHVAFLDSITGQQATLDEVRGSQARLTDIIGWI